MDKARIEALAEAYWTQHVAPAMRQITIDAFMSGYAALPAAFSDWIAAMPGNPAAAGVVVPAVDAPDEMRDSEQTAIGEGKANSEEPAEVKVAAAGGSAPAVRPARQLKGLSAATYEIVMRAKRPLLSKDVLKALRERDGGDPTPARDNTLLASMRRLRNAKIIAWDGTYYSPMPTQLNDSSQSAAADRPQK